MKQEKMPIVEALTRYQQKERVSLHTPGHKQGRALPEAVAHLAGPFAAWDATELPGLDDLYAPSGPIAQAQELAAAAFGCDATHFLVGGSTAGNLAAILATVGAEDLVLVVRNAHHSVWGALELARAKVVVLTPPPVRSTTGLSLWGPLQAGQLQAALQRHPDAKALIVTSPTYEGVASDVQALVAMAHEAGLVVLVDEAHGVHLPFHPDLPTSAVQAGADMVVQSAHKMAAALTQTGFLHLNGKSVDSRAILTALRTVQTSSPSYLLLASLDALRAQLAAQGRRRIDKALCLLRETALRLRRECPDLLVEIGVRQAVDPFKWVLDARAYGYDGCSLARKLWEQHGIFVELCDEHRVLLLWTYGNGRLDVERVIAALIELCPAKARALDERTGSSAEDGWDTPEPDARIDAWPRSVAMVQVPLDCAAGRRAGAPVIAYPPGIPLALRGERFTARVCERIARLVEHGVRVDGVDPLAGTVCCLEE